jgi:hypothetical protein
MDNNVQVTMEKTMRQPKSWGAQGTVQPIEAGYYRPILRRVDGVWKIATMRIAHSLPMAFPGQ